MLRRKSQAGNLIKRSLAAMCACMPDLVPSASVKPRVRWSQRSHRKEPSIGLPGLLHLAPAYLNLCGSRVDCPAQVHLRGEHLPLVVCGGSTKSSIEPYCGIMHGGSLISSQSEILWKEDLNMGSTQGNSQVLYRRSNIRRNVSMKK